MAISTGRNFARIKTPPIANISIDQNTKILAERRLKALLANYSATDFTYLQSKMWRNPCAKVIATGTTAAVAAWGTSVAFLPMAVGLGLSWGAEELIKRKSRLWRLTASGCTITGSTITIASSCAKETATECVVSMPCLVAIPFTAASGAIFTRGQVVALKKQQLNALYLCLA